MMRIKNNTKVKLISLFSAVALWIYVIAIVDPEDTKLIENIPVTVSNMEEVSDKDLVIYPKDDLLSSINVSGKLSNVKNINKDDIKVYGEIDNPIEGKNEVYLRANMSDRVSHEFTQNTIIVNLEKKITKELKVYINISSKDKENIESIKPKKDYIEVSGPRTQMNKVKKIIGKIDSLKEESSKHFIKKVRLIPIDSDGKEVKGIEISDNYINVDIKLLSEKKVPIKVSFGENEIVNYKISQEEVSIKGKEELLKNIQYIETEKVSSDELKDKKNIDVKLVLPNGVKSDEEKVKLSFEK